MRAYTLIFFGLCLFCSCSPKIDRSFTPIPFDEFEQPAAPDYSNPNSWAALPNRHDAADSVPDGVSEQQATAKVDVFFIHPTTFIYKDSAWNVGIDDPAINAATDNKVMANQASVFNGSGRIYAPRYRQAHLKSYFNVETGGRDAIEFAYQDVKRAFQYYLEHYNNGRPVIIASHSQGTTHAIWLLREFFDNQPLQKQLVAAYLPGMPVRTDSIPNIPPCTAADDVGCFVSWCTFANGYYPKVYDWWYQGAVTTNPITWQLDSGYNAIDEHQGILYFNYQLKLEQTIAATTANGILWIKKPRVWYRVFLRKKNWHVADYNLFWLNIRENVAHRVERYLATGYTPK